MRLIIVFLAAVMASVAPAQIVNNWINPVSARWESLANWSLGSLPAANQTVNITNAGYKAVDLDSVTFANFPETVTVSNVVLAAPTNGLNTLLLNYAGLNTPFKVLNGCSIGANAKLDNFYSSFEMDGVAGGALEISGGGEFNQEGGQTTATVPINIRNGTIALTNGNMTLGTVSVGMFYGPPEVGTMIQNGGNVAADRVAVSRGAYNFYAGILYAINGTIVNNSSAAVFHQNGGTNYGDIHVYDGSAYILNSGMCQGKILTVTDYSQFQQNGGLAKMEYVNVIGPGNALTIDDVIGYYLRDGEVQCGTLTISENGLVQQEGGHLILTNNFDLHGQGPAFGQSAYFILVNGKLSIPSMTVGPYAGFNQRGGTNEISGGLTVISNIYYLPGGTLETTYTGIGIQAGFQQFRGAHYVNGVLSLSGTYDLLGGPLHVNGLYLRGTLNVCDCYQDADFANSGLTDLGGTLHAGTRFVQFGQVRLSTNALLDLSSGNVQVHCSDSSGVAWTPGAVLFVTNWHAGGSNAVYFGASASGLTAPQLAQIQFSNPSGFSPGVYPARILSTGELVPVQRPTLQSARSGSTLVFTWAGNYELLSATNVAGPFTPVAGAWSPWTNHFTKPQEFFKLQGF
jgi:hypothetical protein